MNRILLAALASIVLLASIGCQQDHKPAAPIVAVKGAEGAGIATSHSVFAVDDGTHKVVFLVDATGSMISKMEKLKEELKKAVANLKPDQAFDIIFYQDVKVEPMSADLVLATPASKQMAADYLDGITATGTTDPVPALIKSLLLKPEVLYFVTDAADFPDQEAVSKSIAKFNGDHKVKINTILFVENHAEHKRNAESEAFMKQISDDSGGTFRWVEADGIK